MTALPGRASVVVDALVAGAADDQGLAAARGHLLDPGGPGGPSLGVQVLQMPNVVHLDAVV